MKRTKKNILASAIRLFNKHGLTNVRLQQIADEVGISVGNLAYHFPNKRSIVRHIDMELDDLIAPVLKEEKRFPHLIDFNNQLSSYYALLHQFSFYFLDVLELSLIHISEPTRPY